MSLEIPPGLTGNLKRHISGGEEFEWLPMLPVKYYTDSYILQDGKILLGYKKRGFGQGIYNGFGGKVESGETSIQAALRELKEEAGITAPLRHAGVLHFVNKGADRAFHIDMYCAEEYEGEITETDEMRPEWFSLASSPDSSNDTGCPPIPYDLMWASDRYFIPLLQDERGPFIGRADFEQGENGKYNLRRWWYGVPK